MKIKIVAPIFGFENIKSVELTVIDEFFAKIEGEGISFTLLDPSKIRDYQFDLPLFYKEILAVDQAEEVKVYNIVTVFSEITKSTVNFAAPVVVNVKKGLLAQIALDEMKYPSFGLCEPILDYL